MEINKNKINIQLTEENVKKFLQECIDGYGSMNKNNYEVALFNLLLRCGWAEYSDFRISTILQIPESKVKRLRYEVELVYPRAPADLKTELYQLLEKGSFKLTQDSIQFSIPNKMLRLYLNDLLLQEHRFADSSFNANIVSITPRDLECLLNKFETSEDEREKFVESVKSKLKDSEAPLKKTSKEKFIEYSKLILKVVGGSALEKIAEKAVNDVEEWVKQSNN